MLLNEPTPHQAHPATTASATAGTRELPPVEVDGALKPARASSPEADTVAFTAVNPGGANGSNGASSDSEPQPPNAEAPTVGIVTVGGGADVLSTVALDVDAVKRALAEGRSEADATDTVSLDVAGVGRAVAEAPTVGFPAVEIAGEGESGISGDANADADADPDQAPVSDAGADGESSGEAESSPDLEPAISAEAAASADLEPTVAAPAATDLEPATGAATATDLKPAGADLEPTTGTEADTTTTAYLASTNLATAASGLVAVPETADDVIATIHAAATVVAEADRRARRAAAVKADPWTGLDLHRPAVPEPVDNVLELLAPVLERPLLVVEQPGPPQAADVMALHRSELEVDFVEPPVVAAGAEPPIPPRYGPGLSVLPHIEFPV